MAKAITNIEKKKLSKEEEIVEDLHAILNQIAENRKAIQDILIILQEFHEAGLIDMLKGLLGTREKVGVLAIEQLNQPGMHNLIKNIMSGLQFLANVEADQFKMIFSGVSNGVKKVTESAEYQEQVGTFGIFKAIKDPGVNRTLTLMIHFLQGIGEEINTKDTMRQR